MAAKHRRVLAQIADRTGLPRWKDVCALFVALGAVVDDTRSGSRVAVALHGVVAVFHAPHPDPEIHKAQRATIRKFLVDAEVIS